MGQPPASSVPGAVRTEAPVLEAHTPHPPAKVPDILSSCVVSSLRTVSVFGYFCMLSGAWHRLGSNTCLLNEQMTDQANEQIDEFSLSASLTKGSHNDFHQDT